jgi:hypothetical protein
LLFRTKISPLLAATGRQLHGYLFGFILIQGQLLRDVSLVRIVTGE